MIIHYLAFMIFIVLDKKTFLFHLILFRAIGFYLSNGVTDTIESSSVLIYLIQVKGISIQKGCID
jgi:hypothetical protein